MKAIVLFVCAVLLIVNTSALAGEPLPEPRKEQHYTLFNPVPRDQMRPFRTDQTTFTINPYTVDAGHIQVEADIFDYIYDNEKFFGSTFKTRGWIFGWNTVRIGLCENADFEISTRLYENIKTSWSGFNSRTTGFGDVTLSSKINLWGNDGGQTAFAILPSVTFPTAKDNDIYSGGIRFPFLAYVPWDTQLGLMTGFQLYDTDAFHAIFVNSISLRREIFGPVQGYVEFVTYVGDSSDDWQGTVNGGLSCQLTRDLLVHAGISAEVHNSTDYSPYLGFTWRH